MLRRRRSNNFVHGFSTSVSGTKVCPGRVVPDRGSNLLLSDRDERNEIAGTARHGFLAFG